MGLSSQWSQKLIGKPTKKPEFIALQGRRPSGLFGHIVAHIMALETRADNDRALDLLELRTDDDVCEVGFGHGATLRRAAEVVRFGYLAGADFSEVMVSVARRRNRQSIKQGRMDLVLADTTNLPFGDDRFSKAFSVHTIYFWPKPEDHLKEVFRVLRQGGRFVLGFRPHEDAAAVAAFPESIYHFPTLAEARAALEQAGFSVKRTVTSPRPSRLMTWIVAEKPLHA
jgi:SAM-dependent methyltransferase